jgi:hypothetical protein
MAENGSVDPRDPDQMIARALESVLEAIPDVPGGAIESPEANPTSQPWAETAAPPGRNKRPLEDLLAEYAARVAAAPAARAGHPAEPHPAVAYLEHLHGGDPRSSTGKRPGKRRWHGRHRRRGRRGGGTPPPQ